jgi:hypothetical protein
MRLPRLSAEGQGGCPEGDNVKARWCCGDHRPGTALSSFKSYPLGRRRFCCGGGAWSTARGWRSREDRFLGAFPGNVATVTSDRKNRAEIVVRSGGSTRRIRLGPVASLLAVVLLTAVAIVLIAAAFVFGSVALGIALLATLLAMVVAILRRAWSKIHRH